jgi:hypothetical protein
MPNRDHQGAGFVHYYFCDWRHFGKQIVTIGEFVSQGCEFPRNLWGALARHAADAPIALLEIPLHERG